MSTVGPSIQSSTDFADTPQGWQQRWLAELKAGKSAAEKWQRAGNKITKVYLDEREDDRSIGESRLNLFSQNVNTLRAMLFGNVPRVEVGRRFEDADDDQARVAAELLERLLNSDIGKQFSWAIGDALNDRLLVGFGLGKVRYEAQFDSLHTDAILTADGTEIAPAYEKEVKTFEAAPVDYVNWRDVLWSPARTWDEVRWFAFRQYMTRDQLVQRFGEKIGNTVPLGKGKKRGEQVGIANDPWQRAEVWEVWCSEYKTVYWVCEGMDVILDSKEDPLLLQGFYPNPMPMMANVTTGKYEPRADFTLSQDQYNEINEVTTRLNILRKAVKVVGVYDKAAVGVQRMLTEGTDNEMIPVDNWAMFAEKGGIKGQVDWMPTEEVVKAITALQGYRAELINQLYQSSGMSDILRGSTERGETATAQSIKAKFASVRVQHLQDDFARFATDLQRLRAEVMVRHFDDQSLMRESNMEFSKDREHLPGALQLLRDQFFMFRISIKSETLAAQDMAALRQEKSEFIAGLAQFLQASQPLIEKFPSAAPTLLEMLKWSMTAFKGASTIEGILDSSIATLQQNPPPPPSDPNAGRAQAEQARTQAKMQGEQQKIQLEDQLDARRTQRELQADLVRSQADLRADVQREEAQAVFSTEAQQRQQGMRVVDSVLGIGSRRPAE